MKHLFSIFLLTFLWTSLHAAASESRDKYNFNSGWLLSVGDKSGAEKINYADADWKEVTLPYAFNENEAFRLSIEQLIPSYGIGNIFASPQTITRKKSLSNLKVYVRVLISISMANTSASTRTELWPSVST